MAFIPPEYPGSSKGESESFYRQAFGDAHIFAAEGFLRHHPDLPKPISELLKVRPCIPKEIESMVSPAILLT
jgi:hypothetical protein